MNILAYVTIIGQENLIEINNQEDPSVEGCKTSRGSRIG
jgi:catabolite regulation protein CreA